MQGRLAYHRQSSGASVMVRMNARAYAIPFCFSMTLVASSAICFISIGFSWTVLEPLNARESPRLPEPSSVSDQDVSCCSILDSVKVSYWLSLATFLFPCYHCSVTHVSTIYARWIWFLTKFEFLILSSSLAYLPIVLSLLFRSPKSRLPPPFYLLIPTPPHQSHFYPRRLSAGR